MSENGRYVIYAPTLFDRTHSYLTLYLTTLGFAAAGLCALAIFLLTPRARA